MMKIKLSRCFRLLLTLLLVFSWLFSGWPVIWQSGSWRIPPKIKEARAATNTETFTAAGSSTWTAPAGVTSVDVETWGGGGAGGPRSTTGCGGGGGGGAYAKDTVAVTPGTGYGYTVGAAGASGGANGGNSIFNTTSVIAEGGKSVPSNTVTGGSGGLIANSTGTTKYDGGSGWTCTAAAGGGGGGSGGTGSNGNTATSSTGASAVAGGGPGGNGAVTNAAGSPPASGPGGGGGGAYRTNGSRAGGAGYAGQIRLTYTIYTVLGNGTDPGNSTIGPGASATEIDRFSFVDSFGTDTTTDLTVTLGPANAYTNVATVDVQTTAGVSKCSSSSITSNTVALSSCAIAVTTALTEYKIMITPKAHADMPAVPGASYDTTATVTGFTATNTSSGSDTGSATVTIDNLSPGNVTGTSGTPGSSQVTLNWTNPGDSDFAGVVVLHRDNTAVGDTPAEGNTYIVGNTIGSSTVACVESSPTATCIDTGLTGGTPYHYKIFTKDSRGNYDAGTVPTGSPFTPQASVSISITTDGQVSLGLVGLGATQSTYALSHPETVSVDSGPANLNIKSTNFTEGVNTWTLNTTNGINLVKWEFSKDGSSWTTFASPDPASYTFDTSVAQGQTRNIYLRITMPTETASYNQFSSTVTVMASAP